MVLLFYIQIFIKIVLLFSSVRNTCPYIRSYLILLSPYCLRLGWCIHYPLFHLIYLSLFPSKDLTSLSLTLSLVEFIFIVSKDLTLLSRSSLCLSLTVSLSLYLSSLSLVEYNFVLCSLFLPNSILKMEDTALKNILSASLCFQYLISFFFVICNFWICYYSDLVGM